MKRLRIYIDTSVIGGCFDQEFSRFSMEFFDKVREGKAIVLISEPLLAELQDAPPNVLGIISSLPENSIERIINTAEVDDLSNEYVKAGVLSLNSKMDAMHVAMASVYKADIVLSWNFKHFVNLQKIRGFQSVNMHMGYGLIEIRSPREVIFDEKE